MDGGELRGLGLFFFLALQCKRLQNKDQKERE